MRDTDKLTAILAKRPDLRERVHEGPAGNYYVLDGSAVNGMRMFVPWLLFDHAMMLLEGMRYEVCICDEDATCRIVGPEQSENTIALAQSKSPARAMFEAAWQAVGE